MDLKGLSPADRREFFEENSAIFTSNKMLFDSGRSDEFTPPLTICEYCGKEILTWAFGWNGPAKWAPKPERCTCRQAYEFWKSYDKRTEAEQEEFDKILKKKQQSQNLNKLLQKAGLLDRYQGRTLNNFSTENVDQTVTYSHMVCKNFCEKFENAKLKGKGIFLTGSPGVGKTHLSAGVALEIAEKYMTPVMMLSMVDLLSRLRATYEDKTGESESYLMTALMAVDLLIIDDLGKESPTDWTLEKLYQIIDGRYQQHKVIIVTTNYPDQNLIERLSRSGKLDPVTAQAIVSRLHEMCISLHMAGKDWRTT